MNKRSILAIITICTLGLSYSTYTINATPQIEFEPVYYFEDVDVSSTGFVSEDIFTLQAVLDADITRQKEEEERKRKEEEERKKKEAEEAKKKVQANNRTTVSNYNAPARTDGRFRLAEHNHDDATIIKKINNTLKNCPLAGYGEYILNVGKAYNVDPYFITAVSIQESGWGKSDLARNNNNLHGRKSKTGGWMKFSSFEECFSNFGAYMANMYLDKGRTTLETIEPIYCPPGNWTAKIRPIMRSLSN